MLTSYNSKKLYFLTRTTRANTPFKLQRHTCIAILHYVLNLYVIPATCTTSKINTTVCTCTVVHVINIVLTVPVPGCVQCTVQVLV